MMFLQRAPNSEGRGKERKSPKPTESSEETPPQLDEDSDILAMDLEETLPLNNAEIENASQSSTQNVSPQSPTPNTEQKITDSSTEKTRVEVNSDSTGQVCFRNEEEWELSCTLPYQFRLIGWATRGEQFFGNSTNADMIVPESCFGSAEYLHSAKYFSLKTRRGKGTISANGHSDGLLFNKASQMPSLEKDTQFDINKVYLECIRRDNEVNLIFILFTSKTLFYSWIYPFAPSSFSDKIEISRCKSPF